MKDSKLIWTLVLSVMLGVLAYPLIKMSLPQHPYPLFITIGLIMVNYLLFNLIGYNPPKRKGKRKHGASVASGKEETE